MKDHAAPAFDFSSYVGAASREQSEALLAEFEAAPLPALLERAQALRAEMHGDTISFSPKVFIPLTKLCRDVCAYCTFAHTPRPDRSAFMSRDEVLRVAQAGADAGCIEALFTLGEKPEDRYTVARRALDALGHPSTVSYLAEMASDVLKKTGLLPHLNPGVLETDELSALRRVSVSQGLMLESVSDRLCERGGPHFGSVGKRPAMRVALIERAGELAIPFTTGILIGIGETRLERIQSLLTIKVLHERYGHIQEVIIQNFRAKADTRMADSAEPGFDDLLWTAAVARIVLGAAMNIQVPPNLSDARFLELLSAGINDWGGISPITPDYVNPEAPWPALKTLEQATEGAGFQLVRRLPLYPEYARTPKNWVDSSVVAKVYEASDSEGWARSDQWSPGLTIDSPMIALQPAHTKMRRHDAIIQKSFEGMRLSEDEIIDLFSARGDAAANIFSAADELRKAASGNTVRYVVNRNINYTNICEYRCTFCAFSKGKTSDALRGKPYNISVDEVARRAREAWQRGATEVCMQGGIHPNFTGNTYLSLLRAVKDAVPEMHVHAFSPLEVMHGAQSLNISIETFLDMLRDAGLGSLPGTAAEILDDEVRAVLCPDKLNTQEWLNVVETAHRIGLRTTATIMFGHMESTRAWARHLLHIRDVQERTGGFTEFVPLPFVHMEAPLYFRGMARKGPTFRESVLMHAVSRLVLHPLITNIQVSWVKLGNEGVKACLSAGANDLGGILMNESISRAAGTEHGQEKSPLEMETLALSIGRHPQQRTTLYTPVSNERRSQSFDAAPLTPMKLELVR